MDRINSCSYSYSGFKQEQEQEVGAGKFNGIENSSG